MSNPLPTEEELLRKALFVPCATKEALHRWIKIYLGLDMPNCKVDPSSTSTPMDVIWNVYKAIREGKTKELNQVLAYSSRDSFKTLGAAVLEVLVMVHCEWSVAHMAAILPQAAKSQQYCKKFFNRPYLRDYLTSKNDRTIEITRYKHRVTADIITPNQFKDLSGAEKDQYEEIKNYIVIVVCTLQGANSEHVPFMVVDEVDVVENPEAYEEAKFIPAPYQGIPPVTLLTSTRKFSFGLVQKEIDRAHESGLVIWHWNIIDVTEPCPTDRHLPEEPKIPIYYNEENFKAIAQADYELLEPEDQQKYEKDIGYKGCLQNCKLFAVCRGRLATEQKSKSHLLKPIDHVIGQFRKSSAAKAKAQLMCWKPSTEGLIYPNFEREAHMLTPAQMAEKITGDPVHDGFTKQDLINLMIRRGCEFYSGLDHGYTHNFAVVTGAKDGNRLFIIDVISSPELELSQKIDIMNTRIKQVDPAIFPDPEDPASNKTLARYFRIRNFKKGPGSVIGGIEIVRYKLMPALGSAPELYMLKDDDGCELLATRMGQYHWQIGQDGRPTDVPDEEGDDELDALRYVVMNLFQAKGQVIIGQDAPKTQQIHNLNNPAATQNLWSNQILQHVHGPQQEKSEDPGAAKGKSGSVFWEM